MSSIDLELTEREQALADIAAEKVRSTQAHILRRILIAMSAALAISFCGTIAGWLFVRHESRARIQAVQASRVESSTQNCIDVNQRNRDSLAKLTGLFPKNPTPREAAGLQSTKLLIAALVPYTGPILKTKGSTPTPAELDAQSRAGDAACHAAAIKRVKT